MVLNNIKSIQKARGFTIVELLVVIVVIGILAAITLVSYSGITQKANSKANLSNASSVLSAAQVVAANNAGTFPVSNATAATVTTALNASDAKIPTTLVVTWTTVTAGSAISYRVNTAGTGACVGYWDYNAAGGAAPAYLLTGTATSDNGTTQTGCQP